MNATFGAEFLMDVETSAAMQGSYTSGIVIINHQWYVTLNDGQAHFDWFNIC